MPKPGSTSARGYGHAHQQARKKWARIVDAGQACCCLCGQPIVPGSKWHLDHTPDRSGYRGPAHERCNTRDGAKRGNAMRRRKGAVRRDGTTTQSGRSWAL